MVFLARVTSFMLAQSAGLLETLSTYFAMERPFICVGPAKEIVEVNCFAFILQGDVLLACIEWDKGYYLT